MDLEDVHIPTLSCDILDKEAGVRQYVSYMLDRTNSMFQWTGLPETIPQYLLEVYLQVFGYAAFLEIDELKGINYPYKLKFASGLYIMFGGIGGERDIYYRPRLFVGANPRLKESINATIVYRSEEAESVDQPCVLMRNDTNYMGLIPLFNRYAKQMVENDISIRSAQINARAQVGIATSSSKDAEAARKYLDALESGKLATMADHAFLEGITVANVGTQSANVIIQLIELQQYLKASWFNDLGLNANFNMKREYISREEIGSQTDVLLPLVDDMLESRRIACDLINSVFGTNISVEKNSAWSSKDQTILNSLGAGAKEADMPLTPGVQDMLGEAITDVPVVGNSEGRDEGTGEAESEGEGAESAEQSVNQPGQKATVSEGPATPVQVNITINNEGGEGDAGETQEKSEESLSE